MSEDAQIGTPYSRMWGCHHAGMWVARLGLAHAKELALTGRPLNGIEAKQLGLVNDAVPFAQLESRVYTLAEQLASIPMSQLTAMKLVVNQAYENMGLTSTQLLGSVLDGMLRNTPEALEFINLADSEGVGKAVAGARRPVRRLQPGGEAQPAERDRPQAPTTITGPVVSHIDLVDQTFRDGQQCLWGMRLRTGMVTPVARELDTAGYSAIDITGSSMFECVLRYSREDPWEGLDHWRRVMPRTEFRSGVGSNRIVKFGLSPDAILDLWVQTLIKHGMGSFWVYDCLYNLDQMKRLCDTIHTAGAKALGAIFYGISPVHTDEWFAARVREMVSWPSVSGIYVEDAPGILTPDRARTLIPAILAAAGDKPVEWHFHNTTGMGARNYMTAVEAGGTTLHTCSRPLANGPSLPSTEQTLANLTRLGHSHGIDESTLPPVARNCERIAEQEGWPTGAPVEYDAFVYRHQLPGGMTGTLKAQLAQYGMTERLDEVLEECVRVRAEFGHPISATPFSQIVGIQAVLNIVTGDRYSMAPDEAVIYLMNAFGVPPAPVDENVRDKVLNSEHGRRFAGWERPQPSLSELRDQYGGPSLSDEELLLRYMVPAEDLEATRAAGPLRTDYLFTRPATVSDIIARFGELSRTRSLRVTHPEFRLDLSRP